MASFIRFAGSSIGLAEKGIEVVKVLAMPAMTLAERLAAVVDDRTAAVLVSQCCTPMAHPAEPPSDARGVRAAAWGRVVGGCLSRAQRRAVLSYQEGLKRAYIVCGGYKHCQLGPRNALLRFPADTKLRPVFREWFSDFAVLSRH